MLAGCILLSGCTFFEQIAGIFDHLADHTVTSWSRTYAFPCGYIESSIARDNNLNPPSSGTMRWTLPGLNGACVEQPKCVWEGLSNTPHLDAADCITRWHNETFNATGCFEGMDGAVDCPGYCDTCGPFPVS